MEDFNNNSGLLKFALLMGALAFGVAFTFAVVSYVPQKVKEIVIEEYSHGL